MVVLWDRVAAARAQGRASKTFTEVTITDRGHAKAAVRLPPQWREGAWLALGLMSEKLGEHSRVPQEAFTGKRLKDGSRPKGVQVPVEDAGVVVARSPVVVVPPTLAVAW